MEGKSNSVEKALLEYSGQILGLGVEFVDESIPVTVIHSHWTLMRKDKGTSELHVWVGTFYSPYYPTVDGLFPAKRSMGFISDLNGVYFRPKGAAHVGFGPVRLQESWDDAQDQRNSVGYLRGRLRLGKKVGFFKKNPNL